MRFFVEGKAFRQQTYLATSFRKDVAERFLHANSDRGLSAVLWEVRIDRDRLCHHVNYLRHSTVANEEEYLFAPYSAFMVREVIWRSGAPDDPHTVVLSAAVDNLAEPEDLPLAPCS